MGYDKLEKAVLCKPEKVFFSVDNFDIHNIRPGIVKARAIKQFSELEKMLEKLGTEIFYTKELEGHPNSVFVRDTAVVVKNWYIKLNMGLKSRRGEEAKMAEFLKSIGFEQLGEIEPPGTVEGGDVIIGNRVAFVGVSSRTNEEGAKQISYLLRKCGFEVRVSRFKGPFLHIGGAMSLINDDTVLFCENSFEKGFLKGFRKIPVSCNDFIGGNVISVSGKNIIAEKRNLPVIRKLELNGFNVIPIDLSEFVKGNGGPSCMVLPLG